MASVYRPYHCRMLQLFTEDQRTKYLQFRAIFHSQKRKFGFLFFFIDFSQFSPAQHSNCVTIYQWYNNFITIKTLNSIRNYIDLKSQMEKSAKVSYVRNFFFVDFMSYHSMDDIRSIIRLLSSCCLFYFMALGLNK